MCVNGQFTYDIGTHTRVSPFVFMFVIVAAILNHCALRVAESEEPWDRLSHAVAHGTPYLIYINMASIVAVLVQHRKRWHHVRRASSFSYRRAVYAILTRRPVVIINRRRRRP
jgi:hypothetical protein